MANNSKISAKDAESGALVPSFDLRTKKIKSLNTIYDLNVGVVEKAANMTICGDATVKKAAYFEGGAVGALILPDGSFAIEAGDGVNITQSTNKKLKLDVVINENYEDLTTQVENNSTEIARIANALNSIGGGAEYIFDSDLPVSLSGDKSFGRYVSGDVIPATGKTLAEIFMSALVEPISPTLELYSSTSIQFNQTQISNEINFSYVINSLNATISSAILEWKRNDESSWSILSTSVSANGVYTHSLTDSNFNSQSFNYRYTVIDSVNATASITFSITPAQYITPSISLSVVASSNESPETSLKREKGNISSILSGTVTKRSQLVGLTSYTLQYSTNNSTWQNVTNSISAGPSTFNIPNTTHNDISLKSSEVIYYRISCTDEYQDYLNSSVSGGNKTVEFYNFVFYGSTPTAITTSTNARNLSEKTFINENNPFDLVTGTVNKRFTVAIPDPSTISVVNDVDALNANITERYETVESGFDNKVYVYSTNNNSSILSIPISVRDNEIVQVCAGNNFALALDINGKVYAWGENDEGQLNVPEEALSNVSKITAGIGFAYVLKNDGTVIGWGNSDNNRFDYSDLNSITEIFSGWYETLFINSSGGVLRRGSSINVTPNFNISSWTSGVTKVAVGRYNMVAIKNGEVLVTGHSNHNMSVVPEQVKTGVTHIHAEGGTTVFAKKGTTYYGWGKADSGEMLQLHTKIQDGVLGLTVTSTYVAQSNSSALLTINDPEGVILRFVTSQGYQLGLLTTSGNLIITGIGGLTNSDLSESVSTNVVKSAIGQNFVVTLGLNNDRRFFIDDAGGTPTLYNVYEMVNAEAYSPSHIHRVTRQ